MVGQRIDIDDNRDVRFDTYEKTNASIRNCHFSIYDSQQFICLCSILPSPDISTWTFYCVAFTCPEPAAERVINLSTSFRSLCFFSFCVLVRAENKMRMLIRAKHTVALVVANNDLTGLSPIVFSPFDIINN